jgi:trk system potassium uptake protein
MNFIIIGCGRVGAQLAHRLFLKGHKVTVIDYNAVAFKNLPPDFLGRVIEGEATHQDVLRRAGIEHADGLAMVTSSDATNAVIGHVAREAYKLDNIVVRNYDPIWRPMLDAFNLQVISSSSWGAQRIEELLYHAEMRAVVSAGNGEIEVYEFTIPERCTNHPLSDLLPKAECVPVAISRSGRAIWPMADTILQSGDVLLVGASFDGIEELRRRLVAVQEK